MITESSMNGQGSMRALTPEEEATLELLSRSDEDSRKPKFTWDDAFQRRLLAGLMSDPDLYREAAGLAQPGYFSNEAHVLLDKIRHFAKVQAAKVAFNNTEGEKQSP
jgi:hypothetical protein